MNRIRFSTILTTLMICNSALAQAPMQSVPDPLFQPNSQQQIQPGATSIPPTSGRPVSPTAIKPLGLVQKAWDNPISNKGPRQSRPGFLKVRWRPDELLAINVREGLLTVIKFPETEEIITVTVSDPGSFEASQTPNHRSVILRALYAGVDGNIILVGSSGNIYNFYVRSMPFNADKLPDTTVQVVVGGMKENTGETEASETPMSDPYDNYKMIVTPQAKTASDKFKKGAREFGRVTPIVAENMSNNIEIKVRDSRDTAIAPIRAWHDDHFTYLDFGPRASSMTQWPVAGIIIQGVESPVGTRVTGRDRSMMVVEAVGDIVLRDGTLQVCLKVNTPNNDGRYSISPINKDPILTLVPNPEAAAAKKTPAPVAVASPPVSTKRPTGLSILYPPSTSEYGMNVWNDLKKKHPNALSAEWVDARGNVTEPPADNATASVRVYGLDRKTATHICNAGAVCTIIN